MLKKEIQIDGFSKSELPIRKVASISNQAVRHCCFLGSYNYHYFGPALHANAPPFALPFILLQRLLGRALDGGRELWADKLAIRLNFGGFEPGSGLFVDQYCALALLVALGVVACGLQLGLEVSRILHRLG